MGVYGTCPSEKEKYFTRALSPVIFEGPAFFITFGLLIYVFYKFRSEPQIPIIFKFLTYAYLICVLLHVFVGMAGVSIEIYFRLSRYKPYCIFTGYFGWILATAYYFITVYFWFLKLKTRYLKTCFPFKQKHVFQTYLDFSYK